MLDPPTDLYKEWENCSKAKAENTIVATSRQAILLVDDEGQIRRALHEHLAEAGFIVFSFETADQATRMVISATPISLIITDILMPGKANGFDLIETANNLRPGVRTIAISGYTAGDGHRVKLADKFLQKPFTFVALEQAVAELI